MALLTYPSGPWCASVTRPNVQSCLSDSVLRTRTGVPTLRLSLGVLHFSRSRPKTRTSSVKPAQSSSRVLSR